MRPIRPRQEQGVPMSTIHFKQSTTATPEQFVAGLTDFGPGRSQLFGNSADKYLKVHDQGPGHADVTEGSAGIWERLNYDWSDPNRVVMTTTDSNVWGGHSGHTYTLRACPTAPLPLTLSLYARGRILRVGCSGSCWGLSARASWRGRCSAPRTVGRDGTSAGPARRTSHRRAVDWDVHCQHCAIGQ